MPTTLDKGKVQTKSPALKKKQSKQFNPPEDTHSDRRADRRLDICLPVEIYKLENQSVRIATATRNISTGGAYFELDQADIREGDDVRLQVTIPPMEGVSPYTVRAECMARVIRVGCITSGSDKPQRFGVATRFLDRLQFSY